MEDIAEEMRVLSLQVQNLHCPTLVAVCGRIEQVKDMVALDMVNQFDKAKLEKMTSSLDTTNGDYKTNTFKSIIFENEVRGLKDLERSADVLNKMKSLLSKMMLLKSFGGEKGDVQWSAVRASIDAARSRIDIAAGAAAAAAM